MKRGSNPFEDLVDHPPRDRLNDAKMMTMSSSNPFDQDGSQLLLRAVGPGTTTANTMASRGPNPFEGDNDEEEQGYPVDDKELLGAGVSSIAPNSEAPASAEASWQYLGDLPYRRIPIYQNVRWTDNSSTSTGLAQFPSSLTSGSTGNNTVMDSREIRQWIHTCTVTQVEGCPHGGPIAAVTLPLHHGPSSPPVTASNTPVARFNNTEVRVISNSGQLLAKIHFPQKVDSNSSPTGKAKATATSSNKTQQQYIRSASDIFKIGFTERGILLVIMRDSLCFTFDIQGQPVLPPFFLLPGVGGGGSSGEVVRAQIYGQGVVCLTSNQQVAVCEFLHESWDSVYLQGAHIAAREIKVEDPLASTSSTCVALITPITVATEWSSKYFKAFKTIAVLPRHCTSHGRPEVFLSTDDNSVVIVTVSASMELVDVDCRHRLASPIIDMSFCPNGRFLACFTEACMLTVMSTTFETKVLDFDTSEGSSSPPLAMQWCGEDSVVLHWKNMGILMVGPYGDWLRFPYTNTSSVYLIPEMDACRVITDSTVELLQRVPPMTANVLRIGSIEGSALLLEAADAFGAGKVSDDVLLTDNPPKDEDISVCIEAATKEFDIATQKRLLRAASYGMQYLKQQQASVPGSNGALVMGGPLKLDGSEDRSNDINGHPNAGRDEVILPSVTTRQFVAAARKLRILNALRHPQVGFVLTVTQYDALSPTGVLARLISMQRPSLATRLAVYLRLPKAVQLYARASKAALYVQKAHTLGNAEAQSDSIIAEKAIAIIQNEEEDGSEEGDNMAKNKNNNSLYRGAYATVATAATKAGRPGVANQLLLLETSVSDKVPALISNGSHVQAMAVATQAHDGDYVFSTLMDLEKYFMASAANAAEITKAQSLFWQVVTTKLPLEAFHTLRRYYLATGGAASSAGDAAGGAVGLLMRAQRHTDAGMTLAKRALVEEDPREQQGILQETSAAFGMGKDTAFYKVCTDDYIELLNYQEVIRTKYGSSEVAPPSTSVTATLVSVLNYAATHVREQHRLLADADRIAKKFRIADRRLWHVKVTAFAESGQWSNLRLLADSRNKSPIGYAPFARATIRGRQPASEINRYIEKITVAEERCDLLAEAGMWKRALEEAIRLRDLQRIQNIKSRCNSPELQMQAEQAIGKLST